MQIEEFTLERIQSLYENTVELNLSDSGVHPMSLGELLNEDEVIQLCELRKSHSPSGPERFDFLGRQRTDRTEFLPCIWRLIGGR